MRRLLQQKGQHTQIDYNREAERFMKWCQGTAAGAPPSKALYQRYFLAHEKETRFQNSGVQMICVLPCYWVACRLDNQLTHQMVFVAGT